ncbi:MAG: hypothetical protein FIA95_08285, partial [Gemmatimonadetes bacterium]|nr:hypothetical protein [Gemmatimonadota bacterium]
MTQTTAITEAAGPSARGPAPEAVPAEVAQRQLDSALAAELAVPASAGPDPLVPAPPRALPGILLLLFCLAVLLGVRLRSRGGLTRRRRPGPAY